VKVLDEPLRYRVGFGVSAVRLDDLRTYLGDKQAVLPPTDPPVDAFDVVQLEALLDAIQRAATPPEPPTKGQAAHMAELRIFAAARLLIEQGVTCGLPAELLDRMTGLGPTEDRDAAGARWFIGAAARLQWQALMSDAIDGGLRLVDSRLGVALTNDRATLKPPPQRETVWQQALLRGLAELNIDPLKLPQAAGGRPGVPKRLRDHLKVDQGGPTKSQFKHAWEDLLNAGEIRYA
jgi:hypothetical protein